MKLNMRRLFLVNILGDLFLSILVMIYFVSRAITTIVQGLLPLMKQQSNEGTL